MYAVTGAACLFEMLNGIAAQTSDIFSFFIIALAIAAAAWFALCKKR